jgi:dTDP-4-amino-4,6-dideoxygalactose transaminase
MEKLDELQKLGYLNLPEVPERRTNNAHLFYIKCRNLDERSRLIDYMKSQSVLTVFHYIPLHTSTFFKNAFGNITLPNCEKWGNCLLRLPLFYSLQEKELEHIVYHIYKFYNIKA